MPQHTVLDIGLAVVGINQRAVGLTGDGVDGEIPPRQILFQCDVRIGMEDEAFVAGRGFAFGPRQGIFFTAARMQEHRKIGADRTETRCGHRFRTFTDHHPVTIARRQTEQGIAHRTADQIGFHRVFFFLAGCATGDAGAGQRSGTGL